MCTKVRIFERRMVLFCTVESRVPSSATVWTRDYFHQKKKNKKTRSQCSLSILIPLSELTPVSQHPSLLIGFHSKQNCHVNSIALLCSGVLGIAQLVLFGGPAGFQSVGSIRAINVHMLSLVILATTLNGDLAISLQHNDFLYWYGFLPGYI